MLLYRNFFLLLLFILISAVCLGETKPNDPQQPTTQSKEFHLPKGTTVKLRVVQPISSATAKLGDHVDLEVIEDIKIDGTVIVPKGGKAEGFVAEAVSGKMWGAGKVAIYVGSVLT